MKKYKNPEERKISVPFSVSIKLIGDFEAQAEELGYDKSKMASALLLYFVSNKNNKKFVGEIVNLIK